MIIYYLCEKCKNSNKKYYKDHKLIKDTVECDDCKGDMERQLSAPSSKSTQIIDNGLQEREVEVMNDVIQKETDRVLSDD